MSMADADPLIDVVGLAKAFGGRAIISGVSLTVNRGDLVSLIGANGGGKTTTLRMLAGLLRPDAGRGQVLGCDINQLTRAARSEIGYMTQRHALYPELTVRDNLEFRLKIFGLPANVIEHAIHRYDLGAHLETRFDQLSGGWARRVQLAATMLNQPKLILLDEPTAGLDAVTRRDIWAMLIALAGAGHAIVVSTHDLVEAEHCTSLKLYDRGVAHKQLSPSAFMLQHHSPSLDAAIIALAGAA